MLPLRVDPGHQGALDVVKKTSKDLKQKASIQEIFYLLTILPSNFFAKEGANCLLGKTAKNSH